MSLYAYNNKNIKCLRYLTVVVTKKNSCTLMMYDLADLLADDMPYEKTKSYKRIAKQPKKIMITGRKSNHMAIVTPTTYICQR